jgi:SAM-dependent methyltransferase
VLTFDSPLLCADVYVQRQGMEGKFDMVVCLLGTLSHMLDNKQAAAAFRQAARHLRPGGMLLLELAHPGRTARP